ncbi:leucine-rich repeat domain-containing protein [Enterococcus xiangfangensis]|uniref:leucine-rich repeat domain-containing protein n=1 Tax=Enterococcus xiangfangensis TaxID=1296537 RepID=UPI003D17DFD4
MCCTSSPTHAAASYDSNTLMAYDIPDEVIQVILDNSTYSDGTTPSSRGQTPASFTIGDVEQLVTISLATRSKNNNGTYTSTPNAAIANWVASLTSSSGYDVSDNAYRLNAAGTVDSVTGSLTTKELTFDSHSAGSGYRPPFNFLMQILASATNATTVDLTGMTSKITNTTLVEQLLCLFQTDRLPALKTLILTHNNLVSTTYYKMASTIFGVTDAQSVTTLDLSYNNMKYDSTSLGQSAFSIMKKLTNLNLVGNDVNLISGWLTDALNQVTGNDGSIDISDGHLDTNDYNTLNTIMVLLNAGKGDISLNDETINDVFVSVPLYGTPAQPTVDVITKYLPQLTDETIRNLIDNNRNVAANPEFKKMLEEMLNGHTKPPESNSLQVEGGLNFGQDNKLSQIGTADIVAKDSIKLSATITAGSSLMVSVNQWVGTEDGSTFNASLIVPAYDSYWNTFVVDTDKKVLYQNTTAQTVKINKEIVGLTLNIPADQQTKIHAEISYNTTINWSISNNVAKTQN